MWIEERENGKFKYNERYFDCSTGKKKRISVTLEKNTPAMKKKAQEMLDELIDKANSVNSDNQSLTIKELGLKYLNYQEKIVKKSTLARNKSFINTICSTLGEDTLVNSLNARFIQEKLIDTGKENGTLNELLKRIKAFLRWGYQYDYIDTVEYLQKIKNYKDISYRSKIENKYLEKNELYDVLKEMEKVDMWLWRYLTEFLALSGLRIGEATCLLKGDIDLNERIIRVSKTYDQTNDVITSTKTTTSNRDVFIQDELYALIKKIDTYNKLRDVTSIYFISDEDGKMISYDAYRMFLKRKTKKITSKQLTPHALRHTHASLMSEQGVPLDVISRRLGHSDSKVTREIYLHITNNKAKKDNQAIKKIKLL